MAIRVGNVRTFKGCGPNEVAFYVGRPNANIPPGVIELHELRNRVVLTKEEDRNININMYETWLNTAAEEDIKVDHALRIILEALKKNDVVLLCWCYPKHCHANAIAKKVEEMRGLDTAIVKEIEADAAFDRAIRYGSLDDEIEDQLGVFDD